ncbi:MAG TPA: glycosyltransferase [Vicinamibacterales bacterium]|nr:glycosyltransferase [Vicinamibacterales bacterium]HOQ60564.1 glycosyltransferase [Vicinamibacterales bacterium]HPK71992.1 glycosyltransferase [Vicinamibacterales bacterium]
MRILMIAPEPFFEARGTPFSEYHRIRALIDLGHTVDLVTYPFGRDVALAGLRIHRSWRPPFVRGVKVGPSFAKLPLDALLAAKALHVALKWRFDYVHSHEEGGGIGLVLAWLRNVPHLYDMHSSLPEQLANFGFSRSKVLIAVFRALERRMIRRSASVIVICRQLEETARAIAPGAHVVLIENAPGSAETAGAASRVRVRETAGLASGVPLVVYTGTFEAYQGLDLLFAAMRTVLASRPDARLLLVGGKPNQVARARVDAERAGVGHAAVFAGERPGDEIPSYLEAADVLVSPRSRGTNTPLKLYQYLRAGRPIVATNLLTHTQVLDARVAELTDPTPEAFGAGILRVLGDREYALALGRAAGDLAATRYTYESYVARTREALAPIAARAAAGAQP